MANLETTCVKINEDVEIFAISVIVGHSGSATGWRLACQAMDFTASSSRSEASFTISRGFAISNSFFSTIVS
ncbi:hypothetical protein L484_018028 [Morus notabilis]|uniref:Uncharacterized protein n=1 Tax=Morus notabilis TaxID=981085 RepID=W9S7Q9_9ROSA|nr:hypothetical protein L484_018028 [Morus notabilis]